MNSKDLLLKTGSLSAAVMALLTTVPADASTHQTEMLNTAAQEANQIPATAGSRRQFILTPASQNLRDAGVHLTGHSSHSSHSSHVSGASSGGYTPDYPTRADPTPAAPTPAAPSPAPSQDFVFPDPVLPSQDKTPAPSPAAPVPSVAAPVAPKSPTPKVLPPDSVIPPVTAAVPTYVSKCPGVTEHILTSVELAGCSDAHLRRLLQTIFAGYGYSFKGSDIISTRARKHYSSKPWYKPDTDSRAVILKRLSTAARANEGLLTRLLQERGSDTVD